MSDNKNTVRKEKFSSQWRELFAANNLSDFDSLWNCELNQVQAPNTERNGISYVYRLELETDNGPQSFYIKRQQNYNCFFWRKPWRSTPVCEREWYNSVRLQQAGVPAIEPVYYGRRRDSEGNLQAIFITAGLDGYEDLRQYLKRTDQAPEQQQRVLQAAGQQVRLLHDQGFVHHCLYPNHIYIKQSGDQIDTHFIDLEKLRPRWLAARGIWRDFQSLYSYGKRWPEQQWQWLLQGYVGEAHWNPDCEVLQRKVERKASKKR